MAGQRLQRRSSRARLMELRAERRALAVCACACTPRCASQADIGKRVEEKISKDQRRYFLMEQVRGSINVLKSF